MLASHGSGSRSARRAWAWLTVGALALGVFGAAAADDAKVTIGSGKGITFSSPEGDYTLTLGLWGQMRFQTLDRDLYRRADATTTVVPFPVENIGGRQYTFRFRRLRLGVRGVFYRPWISYKIESDLVSSESGLKSIFIPPNDPILGFAGINVSSSAKDQDGRTLKLMDAYVDIAPNNFAKVRLGQFKVPFGRQEVVSDYQQQMVDRSIASDFFAPGRDRGVMFFGATDTGRIGYAVGMFNGVGFNQAENLDKSLAYGARVTLTSVGPYLDIDSLLDSPGAVKVQGGVEWYQSTDTPGRDSPATPFGDIRDTRSAAHVAAFLGRFSVYGEYYTRSIDADFAFDLPVSCFAKAFTADGGLTFGGRTTCDQRGWNLQGGALLAGKHELSVRYAKVETDESTDDTDKKEATLNYTMFLNKHALKWSTSLSYFEIGKNAFGSSGFDTQLGKSPSSGVGGPHFLEKGAFPGLGNDKNYLLQAQLQFAF